QTKKKKLKKESTLQKQKQQDQDRAKVDFKKHVENPRIDREVDGNDPRIDEGSPGVVLPIDPKLPVADADLRADGKHVLRENQRRREGDERDHLRCEEGGAYRLWCLSGSCSHEIPPTFVRRDDLPGLGRSSGRVPALPPGPTLWPWPRVDRVGARHERPRGRRRHK